MNQIKNKFIISTGILLSLFVSGCTSLIFGCPLGWEPILEEYQSNKSIENVTSALNELQILLYNLTDREYYPLIDNITENDIVYTTIYVGRLDTPRDPNKNVDVWVIKKKDVAEFAIDRNGIIYEKGKCL